MQVRHRRYGGTPQSRLGEYITQNADVWVESWLDTVRREETTPTYHTYGDTAELLRDTKALYYYLAIWLRRGEWDPRIDPHYRRVGRDRWREGFPLSEMVRAIQLAKRALWNGIIAGNQLSIALELEVWKAISVFYDQATYHTVLGYEEARAAGAGNDGS